MSPMTKKSTLSSIPSRKFLTAASTFVSDLGLEHDHWEELDSSSSSFFSLLNLKTLFLLFWASCFLNTLIKSLTYSLCIFSTFPPCFLKLASRLSFLFPAKIVTSDGQSLPLYSGRFINWSIFYLASISSLQSGIMAILISLKNCSGFYVRTYLFTLVFSAAAKVGIQRTEGVKSKSLWSPLSSIVFCFVIYWGFLLRI